MVSSTDRKPNRLIHETSPYLLQHAHNPVDWYPWGAEALERARREDRPILLSIGYAACHWCHVMERESFEDERIATLMNEGFVNVKVDREERPDLDDIYMSATMVMNRGQGGWPMTVVLTPDLEPIFAGTYFPPDDAYGRPGFPTILNRIVRLWNDDREHVRERARQFVRQMEAARSPGPPTAVGDAELGDAVRQYAEAFDSQFGGFGGAPKFPPSTGLRLLLRMHRRNEEPETLDMVTRTLDAMAGGGMYDHVGGGFARYSTDRFWLVPHFEKMLYDNALLAQAYLEGFQVTGEPRYRHVVTETLEYVLRDMTGPAGGFFSSTDADSEGEEGRFFVWHPEETTEILGDHEAALFNAFYDITPAGNWEGKSIPNTPRPIRDVARQFQITVEEAVTRLAASRNRVFEARQGRVRPALDDKVLTAWNGLMISAFADAHRVLGDPRYRNAAVAAADFVLDHLTDDRGDLLRSYRAGQGHLPAYLEDYAAFALGVLDLFEAGGGLRFLAEARRLAERMIDLFGDRDGGGFFHTRSDRKDLILRFREGSDGAVPSPGGMAALALVRLGRHLDRPDFIEAAVRAVNAYGETIARYPRGFASNLLAVEALLEEPLEIVIVGPLDREDTRELLAAAGRRFLPNRVQAVIDPTGDDPPDDVPLLRGKALLDGQAAAYVCRGYACDRPVTDPAELSDQLPHGAPAPATVPTVAVRVPGAATPGGTREYAARYQARFAELGRTELRVARIGFGTYRVDDRTAEHEEALRRALATGTNLIDTAANYMDGGAERLVGRVLSDLVAAGDIQREEVVIVSKIGYLQGTTYRRAVEREQRGVPYPDVTKIADGLWHCLHPDFLADELQRSLDRLHLDTLDVCLLHNPEYFLSQEASKGRPPDEARGEFRLRTEAAFRFLETQVERGRIRWYGVSSNSLVSPPEDPDATFLSDLLATAHAVGGADHHFAVVQAPLNLFESSAHTLPREGEERDRTLLELAHDERVGMLANRPLNGFFRGAMVRLTAMPAPDPDAGDVDANAAAVRDLEERFRDEIAADIRVPDDAMNPREYFRWAPQLVQPAVRAANLEQWSHVEAQVHHGVERMVRVLDNNLQGDVRDRWSRWRTEYVVALHRLLDALRAAAVTRSREQSETVRSALAGVRPELAREPLGRVALWVVASTPGVSAVLTGMRALDYVEDAHAVLEWDALEPDTAAKAYQAVAEVVFPEEVG